MAGAGIQTAYLLNLCTYSQSYASVVCIECKAFGNLDWNNVVPDPVESHFMVENDLSLLTSPVHAISPRKYCFPSPLI